MSFRNRFLDAVIDGQVGKGIVITRQELMTYFSDENPDTVGCFLSNSELDTGVLHSPGYLHFTLRIAPGEYRIHPDAIRARMIERGLISS